MTVGSVSNFTYAYQNPIALVTMGIPLVASGAYALYKGVKNREAVKGNLLKAKQFYIRSFTRGEDESSTQFRCRLVKNVALAASLLVLASATIIAAVHFLPTLGAISAALITITLLGDILVNPHKLSEKWANFKKKPWKVVLTAVLLAGGAIGGVILTKYVLAKMAAGVISKWNLYKLLPSQTHAVVFCEYGAVALGHGALGIRNWRKGNKKQALFHFTTMAAGFLFPAFLLKFDPTQVRLHHAFLGLVMSLFPYRPVQFLGTCITADSFRNIFVTQISTGKHQYDFMNLIVDTRIYKYIASFSGASCIDQINDHILIPDGKDAVTTCLESAGCF